MNGELMGEDAAAAQEGEEHVSTVVLYIYLQLPSCYSCDIIIIETPPRRKLERLWCIRLSTR